MPNRITALINRASAMQTATQPAIDENIEDKPAKEPEQSKTADRQAVWIRQIRTLRSQGNRDGVFSRLTEALGQLPDDPELNELLGDHLAQNKDITGAMAAFLKGTKQWESAHSWEGLGICRKMTGDLVGAISAWQEAVSRDPKRAMLCLRLGRAEEERGNDLKALEWYRNLLERRPSDDRLLAQARERIAALENDPRLLTEQADRLSANGDTAGAVALYERIALLTPNDSEPLREAGVGYALMQQFDKALESLDRALRVNPNDHLAWDFKAVTLARMGKFALALDMVDQGLGYCLDAAQLWHRRSFLLGKLNRYQEAIAAANKALELDPANGTPYLFRFDAERQFGKTAEALESITRHIAWIHPLDHRKGIESMRLKWEVEHPGMQLDPQRAAELQEHAFHYWQSGETDLALRSFKEATDLDPFSFEIWNNFGSSLNGSGFYEDAIACFDRAHELYPLVTDFLGNKASVLTRLGRNDEALACHEQILKKHAKSEKSLDERARLLAVLERFEESLAAAEAFAEHFPNRSEPFVRASWALRKLGRPGAALASMEQAIKAAPNDRNLWLNKSTILDELGRDEEAEELQSKAFEDKEFAEQYHQEGLQMLKKLGV